MVDWAGRIGRLDEVLTAAAEITSDADLAFRLRRFPDAVRVIDRALGGAVLE